MAELLAAADDPGAEFRKRARAAGLSVEGPLHYGSMTLTVERYELYVDGQLVELSSQQLELLAVFFAAPHRVWSRRELNLLTGGTRVASRRIDVKLARLRVALGVDIFRSIVGRGWILRPADQLPAHRGGSVVR